MTQSNIISLIILIIIAVSLSVYNIMVRKKTRYLIEKGEEFLNSLSDRFLEIIITKVDQADASIYTKPDDLEDFCDDVIYEIYDEAWDFVLREIKNTFSSDLGDKITKVITKEMVEGIIYDLFFKHNMQNKLKNIMTDAARLTIKEMEEEEKKAAELAEKYENESADIEEYNGEYDISEFEAGRESMVEPEYPTEEVEYSESDETMEVISDILDTVENEQLKEVIENASKIDE